jgi:hypothetical protein
MILVPVRAGTVRATAKREARRRTRTGVETFLAGSLSFKSSPIIPVSDRDFYYDAQNQLKITEVSDRGPDHGNRRIVSLVTNRVV